MNRNFQSTRRIASLALLLGIALSGCAGITASTPPAVQQQIEAARTPADHEALVAYYDREAAAARVKAADHRKMARSYQGGRGGASMPAHCNSVANSFDAIATEYDGMAASHRQLAQEAKP